VQATPARAQEAVRKGDLDIDDRSAALEMAAGARFYLGDRRRVSVRADALWTRAGVFEGWSTHTSVSLGVAYRIGPDSTMRAMSSAFRSTVPMVVQ